MKVPIPPGVFDILPQDAKEPWRNSSTWQYVEQQIRQLTELYCFHEIRTPIFERTELFQKGTGESSDIVTKEMYTFTDKGNRSMTLRPEGTPSVIRALVEKGLFGQSPIQKYFYIGPMFRYERPQAGRYRQHHQFGAEVLGIQSPEQDAELICMVYNLYKKLGLKNLKIQINSLGDLVCRKNFRLALQEYLKPHLKDLSEDSQNRFETNPLRILDSKDPKDKELTKNAPLVLDFLSPESQSSFSMIQSLLSTLNIPFEVNPKLVRGLDYYNDIVFEILTEDIGSQNSLGGGGRYDSLVKTLGGPDLPAVGFASGIERILLTMIKQQAPIPSIPTPDIFLIPLGNSAKKVCFQLLSELRAHNISVQMDFSYRKLNKVMNQANQLNTKYSIVLGDQELETQKIQLKEMKSGEKTEISLKDLISFFKK